MVGFAEVTVAAEVILQRGDVGEPRRIVGRGRILQPVARGARDAAERRGTLVNGRIVIVEPRRRERGETRPAVERLRKLPAEQPGAVQVPLRQQIVTPDTPGIGKGVCCAVVINERLRKRAAAGQAAGPQRADGRQTVVNEVLLDTVHVGPVFGVCAGNAVRIQERLVRVVHLRFDVQRVGDGEIEHVERDRDRHAADGHVGGVISNSDARRDEDVEPERGIFTRGQRHAGPVGERPQGIGVGAEAPQAVGRFRQVDVLDLVQLDGNPAAEIAHIDGDIARRCWFDDDLEWLELVARRVNLHATAGRGG